MIKKYKDVSAEILLTGLPGIGRVGHLAAAYIVNKNNPEKVAELFSPHFPPQALVERGILRAIKNEFYIIKNILLLTGDSQVVGTTPSEYYEYAEEILGFAEECGVKKIITMAGIDRGSDRLNITPGVVAAGSDPEFLKEFVELGAKVDEAGAITGIAGLLPVLCVKRGMKGVCLMGETSSHLTANGDPGAAYAVLELLCKKFGNFVELDELKEAASKTNELFKNIVQTSQKVIEKEKRKSSDYIQ